MKLCPDCGTRKPASDFGRNRSLADGLSFYCLACNRERNSAWYRRSRAALGKQVRDLSWVPEGFRWCPNCRQAVAHEQFVRSSATRSGFGGRCKACHRRQDNAAYFRRRYGLTREDVQQMRDAQRDLCAICGDPSPGHLDHDHATGSVRQLLCQRCNHALGLFRDEPRFLRAAADYVERHRDRRAAGEGAPAPGPARRVGPVARR